MWELIRANKRNSIILMVMMAFVLMLLGFVIGFAVTRNPVGGFFGLVIATIIWIVLALVSLSSGDQIFLSASRAVPVTHDVHPQLFNIVEEMKIAAALPAMPKIYIINDPAPNAFATGRNPESASVAVTAGLLARLNRDELQGVIAHEISHIVHRDILFVTLAGIMLGSIVLLSQVFLRGMFYSSLGGSRRRYSSGGQGGGQAQVVLMVVAIIAAILAPIMAYLLYFALSQRREYLADAGAARLTRYPEGLASALEKISSDPAPQLASANKVTAPMYIVNPFKKKGQMKLSNLTSTHPPISERIRILRGLTHGVSYKDYSNAFTEVTHKKSVIPAAAMTKEEIGLRQAEAKAEKEQRLQSQMRQVGDIMRKVNQFVFLTCACGLKLKIPPNYKGKTVECPRCHTNHNIPGK
ncbi:MAG: M48 family metallopeptidase [Sedimentisphaerales bacterium]|nr:M48 family metallopeptidase [Sedimentisphaerales bacterium]